MLEVFLSQQHAVQKKMVIPISGGCVGWRHLRDIRWSTLSLTDKHEGKNHY